MKKIISKKSLRIHKAAKFSVCYYIAFTIYIIVF